MRSSISISIPQAAHRLQEERQLHRQAGEARRVDAKDGRRGGMFGAGLGLNVGWSLAGSVMYAACQWGTLVVLARLATAEDVGRYAFALAVSAPIMMFLQLQLRTVQVTDTAGRLQFADYLALRAATSVIGIFSVLAVALATHPAASLALIALVACIKALDGISDIFFGEWQKRERMDIPARLQMLNGVLSLALLAGALFAGWPAGAAIAGSLAGSVATVAVAAFLTRNDGTGRFVPGAGAVRRMRTLVLVALPLGLVMALISLTSNIPRYFIESYFGTRELGIFAALLYVTTAGMTLISAIGNSLTPRLARACVSGERRAFMRLSAAFVAVAAAIGIASVVAALIAGKWLLLVAYGPAYAAAANVFVGVMVFGTLSYMASAVGFAMSAARCFRAQAPLFVVVTAAILAGSALWIPGGGMQGAVAALILGALVQLAGGTAVLSLAVRRPAVTR